MVNNNDAVTIIFACIGGLSLVYFSYKLIDVWGKKHFKEKLYYKFFDFAKICLCIIGIMYVIIGTYKFSNNQITIFEFFSVFSIGLSFISLWFAFDQSIIKNTNRFVNKKVLKKK